MTQAETRFKERIRPLLEALPNTVVFKIQQRAVRGVPDFLLCVGGLFVALELKRNGKQEPDPLQCFNLERIQRAQGIGLCVYPENWAAVYSGLKDLAKEEKNVGNVDPRTVSRPRAKHSA